MKSVETTVSFSVVILLVFVVFQGITGQGQLPTWSICDGGNGFGNCFNSISTGDCRLTDMKIISASVDGMFLFYANDYKGGQEDNAIGRFLFMERFGLNYSILLGDGINQVNCIRRVSNQLDYKQSTIMTFGRLEFLTDNNIVIISEDVGAPGNCAPYPVSSLIISGNEEWTIYRNDGTAACLRATNTSSFIPGLVRDTRTIGFEHNSICGFRKGCHSALLHYINNYETTGVLQRTE